MVSGDLADLLAMHVAQRLAGPTKAADRGDEVLRPFAGNLDAEEELECGVYVVDRLSLFRRATEDDLLPGEPGIADDGGCRHRGAGALTVMVGAEQAANLGEALAFGRGERSPVHGKASSSPTPVLRRLPSPEVGRASCRERVWQFG